MGYRPRIDRRRFAYVFEVLFCIVWEVPHEDRIQPCKPEQRQQRSEGMERRSYESESSIQAGHATYVGIVRHRIRGRERPANTVEAER